MKQKICWQKKGITCMLCLYAILGIVFLIRNIPDRNSGEAIGALKNGITLGNRLDSDEKDSAGKVALTFDDGPHPVYTVDILDGLKERGVKATFFVMGQNAELYPEIIKRMNDEGHVIGNHTYYHTQLKKGNREAFKAELIKTNKLISEITGEEVIFVRPPFGEWDKKFEKELDMFPVLWNIDPLDWCSTDVACITDRVMKKVKENSIILMHDYYKSSVQATFQIIDELVAEGYEFVTVEEILFD